MAKERQISLDIVRIIACFCVVMMHSPIPSENSDGRFLLPLGYVTAPSIGLFFMVSGALLLPIKTGYLAFIKKRFSKIIIPTFVWSVIYLIVKSHLGVGTTNIVRTLLSLPFSSQAEGVLWFMYTLAGLYLLAPILSAWLEKASRVEIELVLLLWAISLCYPLFEFFAITNRGTSGVLYYFTGYAGYFLLGYYLTKYPRNPLFFPALGIAISGFLLLYLLKTYEVSFEFYNLFWYESIFIVSLAIVIWFTLTFLSSKSPKALYNLVTGISNLCFGIYLTHILIMRYWLWNCDWITNIHNYPLQCFVIACVTFVVSCTICYFLSLLPSSQWLIGYHKRIHQ